MNKFNNYYCQHSIPATICSICSYTSVQTNVSLINVGEIIEPVAVRYDFDGNGYLYMDAGSGSDWAFRVKDCEFLYTHPPLNFEAATMLRQQAQEIKALHNLVKEQDKKIIDLAFDLEYTKRTDEFVKKASEK